MKKILKIILFIIQGVLVFIVYGALTTASVKNIEKIILVEQFKNKAVYQEQLSTNTLKFYKVESNEQMPTFIRQNGEIYPGNIGDILVSVEASVLNPLVSNFVSFFAGGHAGLCVGEYKDNDIVVLNNNTIETSALDDTGDYCQVYTKDYWINKSIYKEVIGLRCNITYDQKMEVNSLACAYIEDPYNFTFLFDTINKSYCSDLISKIYKKVGINLNKDGFTTSIYDIIVSSDSYISYYHYYDNDGVRHIYYLG